MSVENAKKFIDLIKSSEEIKSELKELCKIEDKAQAESAFEVLAKKNACECSLVEFTQVQKDFVSKLSSEDLANIDAGYGFCLAIGVGGGGDSTAICCVIGVGIGSW